jgi:peptidyl-prolyl cis-trans isomerase C
MMIIAFSAVSSADDAIVAKVNGTVFTTKDLEAEVDRLIPRITFHRSVSPEKRKLYYDRAIEELVNRELQYQDAVKNGMKPDKEKVDAQMDALMKRFKSPEEYKKALEKEGIQEDTVREQIGKEILVQALVAKKVNDASRVSETELQDYYEKNKGKFKEPDSVKLKIISVKDEKKAEDILKKIKAGEDFGDLAYKMSEDSYRVKSGEIGYMHKGRMLPGIEEAAFKLTVGEVSDIIKAEGYYFIIKSEDKKPEHQLSFGEVKEKLKKELETERARNLKESWITDLRAKAKIEILLKTDPESSKTK